MTPRAMVTTALLLGAFVIAAGAYGILYCTSRLWNKPGLRTASHASYVALCAIAVTLISLTPLHFGWKALIAASCVAYLMIPRITWRYLTKLHRGEDTSCDSRPAQHAHRSVAGMSHRARRGTA